MLPAAIIVAMVLMPALLRRRSLALLWLGLRRGLGL